MTATLIEKEAMDSSRQPSRRAAGPALRRCLASGAVRPKAELLRFVVDPDGGLVFDAAQKLPGRGLWLAARRDMIARACSRNLFARAAKRPVAVRSDLADQVTLALRRRCLDLIGLARRAGLVVNGFEKVRAKLTAGEGATLVQAVDAAPGGRQKLASLARAVMAEPVLVEFFTAEELGGVLGREQAVHLLLSSGAITDQFTAEVARLKAVVGTGDAGNRT